MTAYIGYTNKVKTGTVTTTSDATGFAKENAKTYKTSSWWKANAAGTVYFYVDMGSAVDCDSWGIVGHNLADNSGTIKPQYSATGAWAGEEVDFDTVQTPDNVTVFHKVTSQSARYWRFEINSTGSASFFANFFLGVALALPKGMPAGFSPPELNRDNKIFNGITEAGNYTGRTLRREGNKAVIVQRNITRSWIDANWETLADSIELYPFYFIYDEETYPEKAAYCIANKITHPSYADNTFLGFSLDCVALV